VEVNAGVARTLVDRAAVTSSASDAVDAPSFEEAVDASEGIDPGLDDDLYPNLKGCRPFPSILGLGNLASRGAVPRGHSKPNVVPTYPVEGFSDLAIIWPAENPHVSAALDGQ
jgi:hypothetical protein